MRKYTSNDESKRYPFPATIYPASAFGTLALSPVALRSHGGHRGGGGAHCGDGAGARAGLYPRGWHRRAESFDLYRRPRSDGATGWRAAQWNYWHAHSYEHRFRDRASHRNLRRRVSARNEYAVFAH